MKKSYLRLQFEGALFQPQVRLQRKIIPTRDSTCSHLGNFAAFNLPENAFGLTRGTPSRLKRFEAGMELSVRFTEKGLKRAQSLSIFYRLRR